MNPKRVRDSAGWPHHSLQRAAALTWEASDLLALTADQLAQRAQVRPHRFAAVRTHQALQQTRSMLEQAAHAIQRARSTFGPLGLTRAPF